MSTQSTGLLNSFKYGTQLRDKLCILLRIHNASVWEFYESSFNIFNIVYDVYKKDVS